jgi:predicted small metal-binding protein
VKRVAVIVTLACRDIGMDCHFVAKAKTDEKVMKKASKHLRKKHKMLEIPQDLAQRARGAIRRPS